MRIIIKHDKNKPTEVGEEIYVTNGVTLRVTLIINNQNPQETIAEGEVLCDFLDEEVVALGITEAEFTNTNTEKEKDNV